MSTGRLLAGAALVAVVLLVTLRDGADPYSVEMRLANAGGLRDGSPVVAGGVPIGSVRLDARRDDVRIRLRIDAEHAPVRRGATAKIVAQNLLGQKQVQLTSGDGPTLRDGATLAPRDVMETTDLDQVLQTLDTDTRARLSIALNEAGAAFSGGRLDFASWVRDFAPSLDRGGDVLAELDAEHGALANLIRVSDGYVGELADQRARLIGALKAVEGTSSTVAARRAELERTIEAAPGALRSAQGFLRDLRATAGPLSATGRRLQTAAPPLATVLRHLGPFRDEATPALKSLTEIAPQLEQLASRVTPTLRRAAPSLRSLASLSAQELPPVSATLDRSMNNVLATVENWARAIQFRDRLGHVFRGEASFSTDSINAAIRRLTRSIGRERAAARRRLRPKPATKPSAPGAGNPPAERVPPLLDKVIDRLPELLLKALDAVPGADKLRDDLDATPQATNDLLDFLLGDGK